MNTKIALLVIYNHRFDRNIKRINDLYKGKFSHVYHIMPFYDGHEKNVIPVYESSFQFQSYIAQAYQHLKQQNFTHYFIVADDMILNPCINENNLWEETGIEQDECFLTGFLILQNRTQGWPHIRNAIEYRVGIPGLEVENILPTREEARSTFKKKGLSTNPVPYNVWKNLYTKKIEKLRLWTKIIRKKPRKLDYPLVGGYSDIFLVTEPSMQNFCTYCGAFAAGGLFVELAIPTAMVLACDKIKTQKDMRLKGRALWTQEDFQILNKYNYSLNSLLNDFPKDLLFLHPIKLSKWK